MKPSKTYKVYGKKYVQAPLEMGQFEDVLGLFAEIPFEELVNAILGITNSIEAAQRIAEKEGAAKAILEFDILAKAIVDIIPQIRENRTATKIMAVLLKIDPDEAKVLPLTTGAEVIRDFFTLNGISRKRFLNILKRVQSLPTQTT